MQVVGSVNRRGMLFPDMVQLRALSHTNTDRGSFTGQSIECRFYGPHLLLYH